MKKRILGILLALVMVLALLPASAGAANVLYSGTCGDNATWVVTDDGVMTISGTGTVTQLMPQEGLNEHIKNINSIVVEEGITGIGDSAFPRFAELEYPESALYLPDSLKTIGEFAFAGHQALKEIYFGTGLESIGQKAFSDNKMLESVVLPESVRFVGSGAFSGCSALKEIIFTGSKRTEIQDGAFTYCYALETVYLPQMDHVPDYLLRYCPNLKTVYFADGTHAIGKYVFWDCTQLEYVYLPDSIEILDSGVFSGCTALKEVRLPTSLPVIPERTFEGCTALEDVIMSKNLSFIDPYAFTGCTGLQAIYYAGTEEDLERIQIQPTGNDVLFDVDVYLLPAMPDPVFYLYDMPARDNWAYPGIAFCLYSGLMKGTGDGYFQPNGYTTRAQLVTILWRMMGEPKPESPAPFTDLTQDWYRDSVAWAAENNITKGTSATTFAPDEYVTREQMVTIFYRMCRDYLGFDMSPSASLDPFPDNGKVSDWAVDAMKWGIAVKLINGAADGSGSVYLVPQGNAIRSQVATVMLNFVTAFEDSFFEDDPDAAAPQAPAVLPTEGLVACKGI